MWPIDRPPLWVGRSQELAALRDGVEALRRDEGAVIWVEGEPGIGKSSLVAEAPAERVDPEWGSRTSSPSGCRCARCWTVFRCGRIRRTRGGHAPPACSAASGPGCSLTATRR